MKKKVRVLRRGDIVFVQGKGIIADITRFFDKGMFSHCAIAISDSKVIEADIDTRVAVRPFIREDYKVIEAIDLGFTNKQRMDVYNSAVKQLGRKYDYIQLIWYALRKFLRLKGYNRLNNPRYVICSELVFIVLNETGILDELGIKETAFRGTDLTPNELYDLVKYVSLKK
jgi:Permuted papain-like amidase enzyme, YaeF/YiiX, C92 family